MKYIEEFLKLKEDDEKDNIKNKLPKLFNKQTDQTTNLEEKYHIAGLVHEKEDFSHHDSYRSYTYESRRNNLSSINNWKRNKY
jgi:hypothetical protein